MHKPEKKKSHLFKGGKPLFSGTKIEFGLLNSFSIGLGRLFTFLFFIFFKKVCFSLADLILESCLQKALFSLKKKEVVVVRKSTSTRGKAGGKKPRFFPLKNPPKPWVSTVATPGRSCDIRVICWEIVPPHPRLSPPV